MQSGTLSPTGDSGKKGRASETPSHLLVSGNDFYSSPRLSPDGEHLAYLTWNHPNMPWDETELWLDGKCIARSASVFQPEWSPDGVLHFISDQTGWWNLYRYRDGRIEHLFGMPAEFGAPQWVFGMSTYAFEAPDRIICAYNERGRLERVKNEAGTIRITVSDGLGRAVSQWVGTDDTGATHTDPDGSGAPNNMLQVSASVYDGGGVGDGNLTRYTLYPGDGQSVDRVTDYYFDWRNRMMAVKGGVEGTESTSVNRPLRYFELDNLGRTTADLLYDGDGVTLTVTNGVPVAPSSTLLRAKTTTEYDERDRAFRTKQYSVDGSGNVPGNYLKSEQWFDARGNVIKSFSPTGPTTKLQYDGPGRLMNVFVTDASDDTGYGDADDVTGDRVVEQTEYAYDLADNVILTTLRRRFHTTMGTGGLGTNNTGNFARVSYVGTYYDAAYRVTASVDVGTNAGSAYTRPSGVPGRSATTLVTSYDYNPAGWMELVTDPKNIKTKRLYDNAGRLTRVTEAYDASVNGGEPSTSTPATNRRTDYAYGSLDRVLSVTAVLLPDGADAGTEPDRMQTTTRAPPRTSRATTSSPPSPTPIRRPACRARA